MMMTNMQTTTMASTLKASTAGLEIVDQARRKKGWTKTEKVWADLAMTSQATLRRFWSGVAIQSESFQDICVTVGIKDWESIIDVDCDRQTGSDVSSKRLAFAIAGSIEEIDKQKLDAIVALLRKLGGDTSIEIVDVEEGSVKLILGGSSEGLKRIEELFTSGELTEVLGVPIESVSFDEIQNSVIEDLLTSLAKQLASKQLASKQFVLAGQSNFDQSHSQVTFYSPEGTDRLRKRESNEFHEEKSLQTIQITGLPNNLSVKSNHTDTVIPEDIYNFFDMFVATSLFEVNKTLASYSFEFVKIWIYDTQKNEKSQEYSLLSDEQQSFKIYSPIENSSLKYIVVLDAGVTGDEKILWKQSCEELLTPLFRRFIPPVEPPDSLQDYLQMRFGKQLADQLNLYLYMRKNIFFFDALIVQAR